jgi:hypothetical protein
LIWFSHCLAGATFFSLELCRLKTDHNFLILWGWLWWLFIAGTFTADLHEWDEVTLSWLSDRLGSGVKDLGASTAPSARAHHGFVAGPAGLYAFGGLGNEGNLFILLIGMVALNSGFL